MKKAFAALLVLSMLLSAVALAEAADVAGTWYLVQMEQDGQSFNPADFGMEMTLELAEDGTATMNSTSETEPSVGTWTIDGTTVTVTIDDQPLDFALEDGKLIANQDELVMTFSTEAPVGETFAPAAAIEAAEADFEGTWQAAKIGLEGQYYDVSILGADVTATFKGNDITLDGFLFSGQTLSLSYADGALSFSGSDEKSGIEMGIKATLLEDGMMALDLDAGEQGAFTFYMNRAEATEEAPAEEEATEEAAEEEAPAA